MKAPQPAEEPVNALQQMFPAMDRAVLQDALHCCGGSVDEAVGRLLDMAPGTSKPSPQSTKQQAMRGRAKGRAAQSLGWSAFTSQQHQQPTVSAHSGMKQAAALTDPAAFPELSTGRPAQAPSPQGWNAVLRPAAAASAGAQHAGAARQCRDPLRQLADIHPWADAALLQDVLSAAGQNVGAAAWMLTELQAPNTPAGLSPAVSPYVSPSSSAANSPRSSPARPPAQARPRGASPLGSGHSEALAARAAKKVDEQGPVPDAYWSFRAEALQLSKQWQKAARRATTAFAGGDHSAAHKHAREARLLRNRALAAHEAAAARIEAANNEGRDAWQLDLHGMHAKEALAAVDRRLQTLEAALLRKTDRAGELRVITGLGHHSSGGEGSLGRVVANHLTARQYPHSVRGGAVLVRVRRPGKP